MQRTVCYAVILGCALWTLIKHWWRLERTVGIFMIFTLFTLFSTAVGVTTDIATWRQLVHLTFFASAFVISYICTTRLNMATVSKYLKALMLLFTIVFCFVLALKGLRTQNAVYYVIMFLPTVILVKSKAIQWALVVFMAVAALLSNKRTVLVAVVAYFLAYELLSNKKQTPKKMIEKSILYVMACVGLYFIYPVVFGKLNITVFDELRISHIVEDGGSNRTYIYGMLLGKQMNSGILHWLVGDGYNSVLFSQICTDGPLGIYVSAHNDYLEVLYDYGLCGLVLYIAFLTSLFRKGLQMIRANRVYGYAFLGSVIMTLVISISSHLIIYLNYYVIFFIFWGMCLADHHSRQQVLVGRR